MSRKRGHSIHALVFWTETNEISVLDSRCVTDRAMLDDNERVGLVEFGEPSITAPPGGWPRFLARVLAVSENEEELREMEEEFIQNGTLSFESKGKQSNVSSKRAKRGKAATTTTTPTTTSNSNSTETYDTSSTRSRRNISLDKQELLQRISTLEAQLEDQKQKNNLLSRLNLQLQEGLPKLIENALNKKRVTTCDVGTDIADAEPSPDVPKAETEETQLPVEGTNTTVE